MSIKSQDQRMRSVPGIPESICLDLPSALANLRAKALVLQRGPHLSVVEMPLIDARSWQTHTAEEDWLVWRARRCAERLRHMPIEVEDGETIVGKPALREQAPAAEAELVQARAVLADMPPFPGGDAGHFHPDYEKLLRVGIDGIRQEIDTLPSATTEADGKGPFYAACAIAMQGLADYAHRVAGECERMALERPANAGAWQQRAKTCRRVAGAPPRTLQEALQLVFLAEIALWFGEDHGLTCPGRMDQILLRFYEADLVAGRCRRQDVFEWICCLYIHFNRILWPGSAVAVMVGGRDAQGRTVANELTYLCLAARMATKLVYPTLGLAWHENLPDELMSVAVDMVASGIGDPAFFNDEVIARGLRGHGVCQEDSYNYMNSTCVEIKVAGASNMWVTQPYISCPQGLLEVMADVGTGAILQPTCFETLCGNVRDNLGAKIRHEAKRLHGVWQERARTGGFPLASCLIRDCLQKGQDFDRGGARYNWVENSFVGLANLVDGLLAVKYLVYENNELTLAEFHQVLASDFAGHEPLRQRILNRLPQYGNDDSEADTLASEWAEFLIETTEAQTVGLHRYVPGFFCWVMHERIGAQTGATPDGRRAGTPLADGAGAAQGREKKGPTASVLSTTKWCHQRVLGGLVHNAKFSTSMLRTDQDRKAMRDVIETYLRRGGLEIQINVVGRDTLLDARKHPEKYPDLLVRVAGYSDYFVHLNENMQNEVIARTEHEL